MYFNFTVVDWKSFSNNAESTRQAKIVTTCTILTLFNILNSGLLSASRLRVLYYEKKYNSLIAFVSKLYRIKEDRLSYLAIENYEYNI